MPPGNRLLGPEVVGTTNRAAIWNWAPNISLVYLRFMPAHTTREDAALLGWFVGVARPSAFPRDFLAQIMQRRSELLPGVRHLDRITAYRLAVGLANPAPTENSGTSWNPTYGIPVIPGASLKGLARHYLEEELTAGGSASGVAASSVLPEDMADWAAPLACCDGGDDIMVADLAELVFGGTGGDGNEGVVVFNDSWPQPKSDGWFEVEVLTPHHKAYYGNSQAEARDSDEPKPVHFFLCIRPGVHFDILLGLTRFGRTLDEAARGQALDLAQHLLTEALRRWGVGAKTGSGYGRLTKEINAKAPKQRPAPPPAAVDINAIASALTRVAEQDLDAFKKELAQRQAELAGLSPVQQRDLLRAFISGLGMPIQGEKARMLKRLRGALPGDGP